MTKGERRPSLEARVFPPSFPRARDATPSLIYCPCAGACHRRRSPCSLSCVDHDARGVL